MTPEFKLIAKAMRCKAFDENALYPPRGAERSTGPLLGSLVASLLGARAPGTLSF